MEAAGTGLTKRSFVVLISLMMGAAVLYVVFSLFGPYALALLLPPVAEGFSALLLFRTWREPFRFRRVWLYFGLAVAAYATTDAAWAFVELRYGLNPDDMLGFSLAYLAPNIFLLLGVASFFRSHYRIWSTAQLVVDAITVFFVLISVFGVLVYQTWVAYQEPVDAFFILNYQYLLLDVVALGFILMLALTIRVRSVTPPVLIAVAALLLYVACDLAYVVQSFQDSYQTNNVVDMGFVLSLLLFGVAGLHRLRFPFKEMEHMPDVPVNISWRPAILFLMLSPLLLYGAGVMRVLDVLITAAILVVHGLVSAFLQLAVKREQLYAAERGLTEALEERVAERTADLRKANKELDILVNRDLVTGLYNRRRFQQEIDRLIANDETGQYPLSLLYLDLDRFKGINDAYGHDIGDRVLREMAIRLLDVAEPGMLAARPGGDEFMLALPGRADIEDVRAVVERIVAAFEQPVSVDPWQFSLSVSVGVARYPEDADTRSSLFQMADMAMYHAKSQDATRYAFYSGWYSEGMHRRHQLEMALRKADYDKEFTLVYQPQFLCATRKLVGMEALLRWESPELGSVSPGEFIPVAEATGLILPIGQWVTQTAFTRVAAWNHRLNLSLRMGINFSPKQFDVAGFIESLREKMRELAIRPAWIDVEITENTAMRTEASMEEMLTGLAALGVSISIDDFGTGYSSLSYIKRFDIDCLKIAKPLVDNIAQDDGDAKIVGAIILMAKTMGLRTIAEGVEDEDQLAILQELGCDEIQGFLLGKPVPADRFEMLWLDAASE
jgi:diguanylate cyclase (GGDEF)-like protein